MFAQRAAAISSLASLIMVLVFLSGCFNGKVETAATAEQPYQYEETRALVALVNDAAELVRTKGDTAFGDFGVPGSRWRQGENYIFVLDPEGNMLVHPDPELEGKNVLGLKDINGKPIIRGLIDVAVTVPDKPEGWYHYQWPVPGGILPRWKSTFVRLVTAPSGKNYIVGSGMYNDRMERSFVVDAVKNAAGQIEQHGAAAFKRFHDPTGPFLAKDEYIFVFDMNGVNLALPPFPNLEGHNLLELKDTQGKQLIREMLEAVKKPRFRLGQLYVAQAGRKRLHPEVGLCDQGENGRSMGAGGQRRLSGRCTQSNPSRQDHERAGTDGTGPERGSRL
jgi:hypothetical protein